MHQQNNKLVKIEGRADGIPNSNIALTKWMIAGLEKTTTLRTFEEANDVRNEEVNQYIDTNTLERQFRKDVILFRNTFKKMGSPFEEKDILINAISKHIMNENATKSVKMALSIAEK